MCKIIFNCHSLIFILILVSINHIFDSALASTIICLIPTLNIILICLFFIHNAITPCT